MNTPSSQKMIVCHDMMGGYVKDKFPQGIRWAGGGGVALDLSIIIILNRDKEDYFFYHWQHIGAFIYFSHHFITIPPPSWTNAAHRHGVLSMGTVITEWEDGAKICHRYLPSHLYPPPREPTPHPASAPTQRILSVPIPPLPKESSPT